MTLAEALSISLRYFGCDPTLPLTDRLAMWMAEQCVERGRQMKIESAAVCYCGCGLRPVWHVRCGIGYASESTMRESILFAVAEMIQAQAPTAKEAR